RVIRGLLADEALTAELAITRWHPVAEEWRDSSVALPATPEQEEREYEEREAAEIDEAEREGDFDWRVVAELSGRDEARELARRLDGDGERVKRRWRYVVVGAATQERAEELTERLRDELGGQGDVWVEANLDDVVAGPFQFVGF
ncbi:MAG TPA: hypothetical protein VFU99_05780, partial [Gaiellaceae bacterium]|nr:hypothetical protein [Gaiellaceae bacterium]